jgi:hypothetical protein
MTDRDLQPTEVSEPDASSEADSPGAVDSLSLASVVLSGLAFLTLLRLADRRDRSPAKALGLFLTTTSESIGGTVLGFRAIKRSPDTQLNRNLALAGAGTVLGIITSLLNVNWMRTRRRL